MEVELRYSEGQGSTVAARPATPSAIPAWQRRDWSLGPQAKFVCLFPRCQRAVIFDNDIFVEKWWSCESPSRAAQANKRCILALP